MVLQIFVREEQIQFRGHCTSVTSNPTIGRARLQISLKTALAVLQTLNLIALQICLQLPAGCPLLLEKSVHLSLQ